MKTACTTEKSDFSPLLAAETDPHSVDPVVIGRILEALDGMKFGNVTISIQEGNVTQVERIQKTWLFRKRQN